MSLDEVIDIPFHKNMMVKVAATAVPTVRASSFDSVDSMRLDHQTSLDRDSQQDLSE